MTFTYNEDLSTDLDVIRFRVSDTTSGSGLKPDGSNFTDEEISGLLTIEGSPERTIAAIYENLATAWANYVDTQIGARSEKLSQKATRYASLAKQWRDDYGSVGLSGISIGILDEGISEDAS